MNVNAPSKQLIYMSRQKVMPKLVADRKVDKPLIGDETRITDSESVAVLHQETRDALFAGTPRLHRDATILGNAYRVNGKRLDPQVFHQVLRAFHHVQSPDF
ncbi:MAG TPA: hypothetical protein VMR33_16810 [Candidatus Baltobacteraceae bacterium]|nr:hypothetical protein [Candidatus Baltobacteraceae bacterium]